MKEDCKRKIRCSNVDEYKAIITTKWILVGRKGLGTERDEWCRRYSGFENQNEFARGN